MAESVAIKRLENVTECAICTDDLNDARVLPCVHAYCLKCIDKWVKKKMDGKVTCPICRKKFEVPEGGTAALPKNCFVEKMLEVKKLSTTLSQGDVMCEVCCDDMEESEQKVAKKAAVYCIDCRRSMCEQCCRHHQKFRLHGEVHKLIELNSEMSVNELLKKFPDNVCEKHPEESLKIYCFDCKLAVCTICFITTHSSHKGSDIKEVAEDLGKQMSANAEELAAKVAEFQTVLEEIEDKEREFCNSVAQTERVICERADKLTQLIEDQKRSLLNQLSDARKKQLKQTACVRDEIERHQIVVRNFIRYFDEVRDKGTPCDIAKMAGELNARAEELRKFDVNTDISVEYNATAVNFTSSATDDELKSSFGTLAVDAHGYFKLSGKVVGTILNQNGAVTGIAALNGQLYVSGTQQIAVYCPTTFQHQQDLYFTCRMCRGQRRSTSYCSCYGNCNYGYGGRGIQISNMVGCGFNKCLYASDRNAALVRKFALDKNNMMSSWNAGDSPEGLSVTSAHSLLVSSYAANSLYEYSTEGRLLRQVSFEPAVISNPVHAIQLSDDLYAVTHHGPTHQLSIVSSSRSSDQPDRSYQGNSLTLQPVEYPCVETRTIFDYAKFEDYDELHVTNRSGAPAHQFSSWSGQLVRSCRGDARNLNNPCGIAADERGRLFVADQNNQRVLVVDSETMSAYPLRLPVDCRLNGPYCIHYDAASGRLYIEELIGQRVICCKI